MSGETGTKLEAAKRPYLELHQKLFVAVILFALAAFIQVYNPFDLSAQHDEAAAELSSLVQAPFAGSRGGTAEPVTVLLVDAGTRSDLGFDTPYMPYDKLAQTLQALVAAQPKAIFLDYSYRRVLTEDARKPNNGATGVKSGLQQLVDVLKLAKTAHVPVFTGPVGDDGQLAGLRAEVTSVGISWHAEHRLDYPFLGDSDFVQGGSRPVLTAAPAIYRGLCPDTPAGGNCPGKVLVQGMFDGDQLTRPEKVPPAMFLNYLPYSGRDGAYGASETCKDEPRGEAFARRALARTVLRTISGDDTRGPSKCIDVPHFSLTELVAPGFDGAPSRVFNDYAQAYIRHKVVMIGDSSGTDRFDAPVFGRIDGVFQHAIALQTLMRAGDHYTRWPAAVPIDRHGEARASLPWNFLLESLISFCVLAAILVADRPETSATAHGFIRRAGLIAIVAGLGAVTAAIEAALHWPLANLLNIAAGVGGVLAITEIDKLISRRWPVLIATLGVAALVLAGGFVLLRSWL